MQRPLWTVCDTATHYQFDNWHTHVQVGEHDSPSLRERINETVLQRCPNVHDAFKQAEPVSNQCLLYLHADWCIKGQCYFVWLS